ncbi:glycosyltransferase [Terrabacter aerolatus]|uniref:Glycosyl transferase family A n=1 Tax=Terrabacter aerolatus TaxID=422442 RepID=A0A512D153_9MICO|nr:galactosyltransferase-related protein [Terrabacter aerolatus]GEO30195.1 glycosyl transferase family A [Terrabacter aerolatus]
MSGPDGSLAVVTIVHGRHEHLERQLWGLRRQDHRPDTHVVVAMDDPGVEAVARRHRGDWDVHVAATARRDGHLPLAAARNLGVDVAARAGADRVVLLDVDCIPSRGLVGRYAGVLATLGRRRPDVARSQSPSGPDHEPQHAVPVGAPVPTVLAGEVAYLPPPPTGRDYRDLGLESLEVLADPHPARPVLSPDEVRPATDLRLFWSLSFALTVRDWRAVGGFDEGYVGYGGEDTDFGQRLGAASGRLLWVGGARAHHQHHPTSSPPVQHVDDVVANANRFAERWGWWPMEGWLEAFAARGLAARTTDGRWQATPR